VAKKSAEKERLAKQQEQVLEKEEKERVTKQEMARLENEAKAKAEAEAKAKAEIDRVTREENEAKVKAEAEAKAKAEKDRVTQEENEAKAKEDAEAIAQSKKDDISKVEDFKDNEVIAKAQGSTFRWPWQKETTVGDVPSETVAEDGRLKQNEDLPPQTASKPVTAASDGALIESPGSGSLPIPTVPAIEEEVSKFVEDVVEDTGIFSKLLILVWLPILCCTGQI